MAQTQTITNTGLAELALRISGGASSEIESIVCLNMATPCTAAVASTFADPADTATHHTDSGLQLANADTVGVGTTTTTGDTVTIDHVFTASATKNVAGIHICNNDDDVTIMECCFNAVLAVENGDTITIDAAIVLDQA